MLQGVQAASLLVACLLLSSWSATYARQLPSGLQNLNSFAVFTNSADLHPMRHLLQSSCPASGERCFCITFRDVVLQTSTDIVHVLQLKQPADVALQARVTWTAGETS